MRKRKFIIPRRYPLDGSKAVARQSKNNILSNVKLARSGRKLPDSVIKGTYRRNHYKQVWRNGRAMGAHRAAWESTHGKIPSGMVVHHKNGNHTDNRMSNLTLMNSVEHSKSHGGDWANGKH